MSEGERDSFTENDAIGNYNVGTSLLANSSPRNYRKKARKHRKTRRNNKRVHRVRRIKKTRSRRKRSHKGGVKYTKNGQPYKILPNGKARFLKKR